MNRRDYLVRMGAAGVLASLPRLDVFGKHDIPKWSATACNVSGQTAAATGLLRWQTTHEQPNPDAFVTAIFWGLMGFCYKTSTSAAPVCEVGFHSGNNHHNLTVTVVEISTLGTKVICSHRLSRITRMALKVIGSGQPPKVFHSDKPFNRQTGDDDRDFRWMPDLESPDFYIDRYDKHKHFGPRLYVSDGVFYTRIRTGWTFKLVKAENHQEEIRGFSHVARIMAAAIGVNNPTDSVSFEINGEAPCPLEQKPGVKYQVIFKNECTHSCPGPNTINDQDETKRNDFHFMRKVLKLPGDRIKYALKVDRQVNPVARLNFYNPDQDSEEKLMATDEAPCMGAAFGQTNGFPT